MKSKKFTSWKKNRKFGDVFGGRLFPKRKDGVFRRTHSLSAPSELDDVPIFITENSSRDYFFPVTPEEVRNALELFPSEDVGCITHVWFRKHDDEDEIQAYVAIGSGVVAVVIYPLGRDLTIDLGIRKPSGRTLRWYEGYATVNRVGDRWKAKFTEESARTYYLERLLPHEVGHCADYVRGLLYRRSFYKEENFADNYAYGHGQLSEKDM